MYDGAPTRPLVMHRSRPKTAALLAGVLLIHAPVRAAEANVDAAALARAESLVVYCQKAAPTTVDEHRSEVRALLKNANPADVAQVRRGDEYRKTRTSVNSFLAKVDPHNAHVVCAKPTVAGK